MSPEEDDADWLGSDQVTGNESALLLMTLDELCSVLGLVLNSVTSSLVLHVTVVPVTWKAETDDLEQATMCGQHCETHFKRKKKTREENCAGFLGNKQVEGEDSSGPDEMKGSERYLLS